MPEIIVEVQVRVVDVGRDFVAVAGEPRELFLEQVSEDYTTPRQQRELRRKLRELFIPRSEINEFVDAVKGHIDFLKQLPVINKEADLIEYKGYEIEVKVDNLADDPLACHFFEITGPGVVGEIQSDENFELEEIALNKAKDYIDEHLPEIGAAE